MNIGIDARFYGSLGKGLGRYTQKLIEHLEHIDTHNDYVIFLRRANFEEYQPKNPRFTKVLADYQWYSFAEQLIFPVVLYRHRFDVVHFPHFNIPLLYGKKFIVTIHDLILLHFPTQKTTTLNPLWYRVKFLAYRLTIWWAIGRSAHIMTVSEYTKQDLQKYYRVSEEKITVAYEATDDFCWYQSQEKSLEILQRIGLTSSNEASQRYGIIQPYFLYVGNAYPHKNLESLVALLCQKNNQDMLLVLVGKEDYFYRRLKQLVRRKKMNNVLFAGFVPDEELDVLYRYGRAYVFPSLYEGFGLPPLEAMAKGLPVVAAQATSLPEILGNAALYFDPKESSSLERSLRKIWEDASLRQDLLQKGYQRIGEFHWQSMAEQTLKEYEYSR